MRIGVNNDGGIRFNFFFSSRRRHTRWTGDWSSDVCSSDLNMEPLYRIGRRTGVVPSYPTRGVSNRAVAMPLRPSLWIFASYNRDIAVTKKAASRSEERRVGKECRARWGPVHEQKKGDVRGE